MGRTRNSLFNIFEMESHLKNNHSDGRNCLFVPLIMEFDGKSSQLQPQYELLRVEDCDVMGNKTIIRIWKLCNIFVNKRSILLSWKNSIPSTDIIFYSVRFTDIPISIFLVHFGRCRKMNVHVYI